MKYGTTDHHWSSRCGRPDQIHVQKKHDLWDHWSWGSRTQHSYRVSRLHRDQDIIYADLPLSDCMERSLSKRRFTRREYQICILETCYPCKKQTNITKSEKPVKRKYKNGRCIQTRSVCRDQSSTNESCSIESLEIKTKRLCIGHRPTVNVTIRDKVLQGVGSNLIAPWLTPDDLHSVKQAFRCDWDWGQTWHGGKVKNKKVAAKVVVHMRKGTSLEDLNSMFGADNVFSALWYILPCKEFVSSAHRLKHWQSIRKLDRLK